MSAKTSEPRRHDLDALRALAMLLGILLHAVMTFMPGLWPVQDSTANPAAGIAILFIHGFRMPLFFLVSGFFTALLWRRYGLKGVLRHRLLRILVPCVLGVLTIVPLYRQVVKAALRAPVATAKPAPPQTLAGAAKQGDMVSVKRLVAAGADLNAPDATVGGTPLSWAALRGDVSLTRLLLERGAKVDKPSTGGATPLHCAALLGYDAVVALLLKHGASVTARNEYGDTPGTLTFISNAVTQRVLSMVGLPPRSWESIEAGRERCCKLLPAAKPRVVPVMDAWRACYGEFLSAPAFATPVFEHLWFLWFLCWLLPFFALWTRFADRVTLPRRWVVSPLRYLWVIPMTMVPQVFMGIQMPAFGADTATGLVPPPHLLVYYGLFFFFGAVYYEANDTEGLLGRRWWLNLCVGLVVLLPLGIATMNLPATITASIQASYAWFMVFGCIGAARRFLFKESATMRYLSDSSYWLYIAHLPLVVALQLLVRDLPLSLPLKLLIVLGVSVVALLASYQLFVRRTLLGVLLNGKKGA